jgi:gamma-glutamyl-gamma-aminobutyrate hydrolase PuuD
MVRLFTVGNWFGAHEVFAPMFKKNVFLVEDVRDFSSLAPTKEDVVLFGGGSDIYPGFYNQKPSRYNGTSTMSVRDAHEESIFQLAKSLDVKMIGICRGAQLLCALSGGSLIQHVTNHGGRGHEVETDTGEHIFVSSAHHQMMNPEGAKHKMIAWSKENLSNCYLIEKEKNTPLEKEPEVVYFPETKALAIQYHPEFMADNSRGVSYSRELVSKYLLENSHAV